MAFIIYNLTHLIPTASQKANFGIIMVEDGRTLNPGRHRIFNTVSENTKRYANKKIHFNGIDYEVLRIVEFKDSTITSPGDRKKLEELLDNQQAEHQEKLCKKQQEEIKIRDDREADILRKRNEDFKRDQEDSNELLQRELFRRTQDQEKFGNNDGVPAKIVEQLVQKIEIDSEPKMNIEPVVEEKKETEAEIAKVKEQEEAMLNAAKEAVNTPIPKEIVLDDPSMQTVPEEHKKVKKSKKANRKSKEQPVQPVA